MPDPFLMVLTHSVAKFYLLQIVLTTSEFTLRVSSLQPTCSPVAHEDDGDSMKNKFPRLYFFKLAFVLCKDVMNINFPKYWIIRVIN